MLAFRIADRRRSDLDGVGASMIGGRWNSPGRRVVYAAESYSVALLEVLVHASRDAIPKNKVVIQIEIPEELTIEIVTPAHLPGWDDRQGTVSRDFGDRWLEQRRTAVLLVPSVVVQGRQSNVLLNPEHPGFQKIVVAPPEEIDWDARLFGGGA